MELLRSRTVENPPGLNKAQVAVLGLALAVIGVVGVSCDYQSSTPTPTAIHFLMPSPNMELYPTRTPKPVPISPTQIPTPKHNTPKPGSIKAFRNP